VKTIFAPLSLIAGLAAGQLAKKIFDKAWGTVTDVEAPRPKHRDIDLFVLLAALVIEGAIARVIRGSVDHALRRGWARLTGTWPGEERPETD
jgi:Protein of unknown function (DUF4235)